MHNHSRSAITNTSSVMTGKNCLNDFTEIFSTEFPDSEALFVSDRQTEKAAGRRLKQQCLQENIAFHELILESDEPVLSADYSYVPRIRDAIISSGAVPVAVGSGTINDLTKCASDLAETPYLCVATASSVDGYCATGAALVKDGLKTTVPCEAPRIVFGDPSILMSAPGEMTSAGYGDLYAKIPGGADWILADSLEIEPIDPPIWDIVQSNLPLYLSDPEKLKRNDSAAFERLFKGLCETGIAMQLYGDSRPASGAEHMISHVWEMEHISLNGSTVSHGFKVSIGTVLMTLIMEEFCELPMAGYNMEKIIGNRESWSERAEKIKRYFPDSLIHQQILKTCRNKWIDDRELGRRFARLQSDWSSITEKIQNQIVSHKRLIKDLEEAGCPTKLKDIGRSRTEIRTVIEKAQMIRERFTILDCLYDLGILPDVISSVEKRIE